jgi:hypothetical protein
MQQKFTDGIPLSSTETGNLVLRPAVFLLLRVILLL